MLLEPEERLRFLAYCREQAAFCKAIASQLEMLGMGAGVTDALFRREENKARAFALVAMDLAAAFVEDVAITADDIGEVPNPQEPG